jgi:ribosomal protein L37AE/L43A
MATPGTPRTEDQTARIEEMRQFYLDGWTLRAIGKLYGITGERVRQLVRPERMQELPRHECKICESIFFARGHSSICWECKTCSVCGELLSQSQYGRDAVHRRCDTSWVPKGDQSTHAVEPGIFQHYYKNTGESTGKFWTYVNRKQVMHDTIEEARAYRNSLGFNGDGRKDRLTRKKANGSA